MAATFVARPILPSGERGLLHVLKRAARKWKPVFHATRATRFEMRSSFRMRFALAQLCRACNTCVKKQMRPSFTVDLLKSARHSFAKWKQSKPPFGPAYAPLRRAWPFACCCCKASLIPAAASRVRWTAPPSRRLQKALFHTVARRETRKLPHMRSTIAATFVASAIAMRWLNSLLSLSITSSRRPPASSPSFVMRPILSISPRWARAGIGPRALRQSESEASSPAPQTLMGLKFGRAPP
jgi:hypothetical protein